MTLTNALLTGVAFADAHHGTVVGEGGQILRTTNAGETWTTPPAHTFRHNASLVMTPPDRDTQPREDR